MRSITTGTETLCKNLDTNQSVQYELKSKTYFNSTK